VVTGVLRCHGIVPKYTPEHRINSMSRPRIGITTGYKDGQQYVDIDYIRAIENAGGLPLIVPMFQTADAANAFAALLDGLVMTGGPGITRGLIGDLPDDLPPVDPVRDAGDSLIFAAVQDQPILGICYGAQFMNAQAGGSIYADLMAQHAGAIAHSPKRGAEPRAVEFAPDSRLSQLLGQQMTINTYHIQSIAEVGAGLRAVGYSPDGIVEAIESTDGRMIGVQFHPECMGEQTQKLFEDFVARCRKP
jgi:putative glutamine amidotransferase